MGFLTCWTKNSATVPSTKPEFTRPVLPSHFMGAGCIFHNKTHILAGYQPNKHNPVISGIGGKREQNETVYQTAFRETLEELLDYTENNAALLAELEKSLIPKNYIENNGYISLLYSFEDLVTLLNICFTFKIRSPYYTLFPLDLVSLTFNRTPLPSAEISHLVILPLITIRNTINILDIDFINDINNILVQ